MRPFIVIILIAFATSPDPTYAQGAVAKRHDLQRPERLIFNGDTVSLYGFPIDAYMLRKKARNIYEYPDSTCANDVKRGYVGLWKIANSKFFLVDLNRCGVKSKSIKTELLDRKEKLIQATWFSGTIYLPFGKWLNGFDGYVEVYEKELAINIKDGVVVDSVMYFNGYRPNEDVMSDQTSVVSAEIERRIRWSKVPLSDNNRVRIMYRALNDGRMYAQITSVYNKSKTDVLKPFDGFDLCAREIIRAIDLLPCMKVYHYRDDAWPDFRSFDIVFNKETKEKYKELR